MGLEPRFEMFVGHLLQVTNELKRVLKPTGSTFIVIGDTYSGSGGNSSSYPETLSGDGRNDSRPSGKSISQKTSVRRKSLCLIPERLAIGMADQGWVVRNNLIWPKPNSMPSSVKERWSNK